MEYGIEVCKGIPESLRALEVGDIHWPLVPVTDGRRIKGELVNTSCVVCAGSWCKRLDPLVRWSFIYTKSGLMSLV